MFSALIGLFSGLISLAIILAPVVVIIILLVNDNKKKKVNANSAVAANTENGQATMKPAAEPVPLNAAPPAPPKPVDPYKKWNILLYLGSFLLVMAMILFISNEDDSLVAPTAIILTLLFYLGGIALFKTVPYLKSVGKSFAYTASAVFPFWVISFTTFGLTEQVAWIVASIISLSVFIIDSLIFKSKVTAAFAYIWLFVLTWSCTPSGNAVFATYWAILAPMVLSLVPTLLWLGKPGWLPVSFRKATQIFGMVLTPLFSAVLSFTFFISDFPESHPFLRSLIVAILLVYALLHWLKGQKYGFFVFARLVAQLLIFTVVADILQYTFFDYSPYYSYYATGVNETTSIMVAIVWLTGCLAQSLIALFIPKKNDTAIRAEHAMEVISLAGILVTPALTYNLENGALIQLLILSFVSILGVIYSAVHKNILWSIATLIGLLLIPTVLSDLFEIRSMNWLLVAYFAVYGLLALLGYAASRKRQPLHGFVLTLVEVIIAGFVVVVASADENFVEIGWLTLAVLFTIFGYLSGKNWLYELAIYSGALCVFSLVGTVGGAIAKANAPAYEIRTNCMNDYYTKTNCIDSRPSFAENAELAISTVRAFVMPIALLAVSFWKERGINSDLKRWRFLAGYILLSLSLLVIGWNGEGYWMLPSLIAQVAFLVYSVFKDKSWLVWTTIAVLAISMISLSGGYIYVWFGVLGIVLILIVVWRLTKLNAQKQREEAKQAIAETSQKEVQAVETPKEDNAPKEEDVQKETAPADDAPKEEDSPKTEE